MFSARFVHPLMSRFLLGLPAFASSCQPLGLVCFLTVAIQTAQIKATPTSTNSGIMKQSASGIEQLASASKRKEKDEQILLVKLHSVQIPRSHQSLPCHFVYNTSGPARPQKNRCVCETPSTADAQQSLGA